MKMTEQASKGNLPKLVAAVIVSAPMLVVHLGLSYFKMKRRARLSARKLESALLQSGLPPEAARSLASKYECDVSLTRLLGGARLRGLLSKSKP